MPDRDEVQWVKDKVRWADERRDEPGQRSYAFEVADRALAIVLEQMAEIERLRQDAERACGQPEAPAPVTGRSTGAP